MDLPAPVSAVCRAFVGLAPPGLVRGLHLRGGLAFGEWIPGHSDVDFVAVLDHRPDAAETAALEAAHAAVHERHPAPSFDGLHVLAADLAADPRGLPPVPTVLEGVFDPAGRLDPMIAWHELATTGLTVHGDPLGTVWTSRDALLEFTRDNLDTYWRTTAEALAPLTADAEDPFACVWSALGVTRLHHLLVTGVMTTKSRAGRWGLEHYPERFHRVLREALAIREGGGSEYLDDAPARARDTAELTAYVVAAGTS